MSTIRLSRTVLRPVQFRWWQPGKTLPLDCTGLTCTVRQTTLPYVPAVEAVDAAAGQFRLAAPTPAQADKLRLGKTYGIHVVLQDAGGNAVEEFRATLEVV